MSLRRILLNGLRVSKNTCCGTTTVTSRASRAIIIHQYSSSYWTMNDSTGIQRVHASNQRHMSNSPVTGAEIRVVPDGHLLVDDELHMKVCGLEPQQKVTVYAHLEEEDKRFESWNWFIADKSGIVDLYSHGSVNGTYTGVSPMGIFWSMEPVPGQRKGIRVMKRDMDSPFRCQVYVHQGHATADDIRSQQTECVSKRTIERWYKAPGVTTEDVKSGRIRGRLFLPPGDGPFQGIVDMFGTVGGLTGYRSALLASRGFASLSLPYFGYDDLPPNLIDLDIEYFQEAVDWLLSHEKVYSKGAGAVGVSKGGDISLLMGAYCTKVPAIVNINGCTCNAIYPFKVKDTEIPPIVLNFENIRNIDSDVYYTRDALDYDVNDLTPVWNNNPKVLNICSEDDMCSPHECMLLMEEHYPADKKENFIVARYPGAGHLVEPPYTPLCNLSYHKTFSMYFLWGGQPKPHADAQEDAWRRILKFLKDNIPVESHGVTSKL